MSAPKKYIKNVKSTLLLSTALTVAGIIFGYNTADARTLHDKVTKAEIGAHKYIKTKCQNPEPFPEPEPEPEPYPEPAPEEWPCPEPVPDMFPDDSWPF